MRTSTSTYAFTRTRLSVIDDHFEMFLRCSNMSDERISKLLGAVERKELSAVGIYIEDGGYRIAEVEFQIDWDVHQNMIAAHGTHFDTNLPGFRDSISPEAYVAAQRLVQAAVDLKKTVRSWIIVDAAVRSDEARYKAVCSNLGYSFSSSPSPWKNEPQTQCRGISFLPEATVTRRCASEF